MSGGRGALDQMFEVPGHRLRDLHAAEIRLNMMLGEGDATPVADDAWPTPGQLWHALLTESDQVRRTLLEAAIESSRLHMQVTNERDELLRKNSDLRGALDTACDVLDDLSKHDTARQLRIAALPEVSR